MHIKRVEPANSTIRSQKIWANLRKGNKKNYAFEATVRFICGKMIRLKAVERWGSYKYIVVKDSVRTLIEKWASENAFMLLQTLQCEGGRQEK